MHPYKESIDDDIRKSAWIAEGSFYKEHSAKLDDIFDKMVYLRTKRIYPTSGQVSIKKYHQVQVQFLVVP